MDHNPEGGPVLVSVEGFGPLFGRAFVDEVGDDEMFELAERTQWRRSWRIDVPAVPYALVQPLRRVLDALDRPIEVRIWSAIQPGHYRGEAYGGFVHHLPRSGTPFYALELRGQGRIARAREWA